MQPELADYWGVLSVPTTFVIDGQGQPRHINHGMTSQDKLRRQIEDSQASRLEPAGAPAAPNAGQENLG